MTSLTNAFAVAASKIITSKIITFRRAAIIGAAFAALAPMPTLANDVALEREQVELVAPPFVHPHEQATKQRPKIVAFRMETQEKEIVIDDEGTTLQAMTFNGSIPGPMMVVHEGDYFELTLVNPATNSTPHSIRTASLPIWASPACALGRTRSRGARRR